MAVQSSFYNTDGSTRTFPSTKHIATQQHCSVYVKSVATSTWSIVNVADFELINNSIVFDIAPDIALYSQIEVRVADTADELVNSPSDIAIVAGSIANVNTVATNIVPVTTVATNIATVQTVSANIANVNTVAGSIANVNTVTTNLPNVNIVATNIADVNSVATTIVPNIAEILLADTNAATATTQAGIATTQATNSQLSAWLGEAEKLTADSYATQLENVFVNTYASNGNGTFTATATAEYSAHHWAIKAAASAASLTVDAVPTNGSANAVSSNGVFDALTLNAPLSSPALTGTPTAPTATLGTNTTQIATTAFVLANATGTPSGVRQTVQSGSVDTSGFPNFLTTSVDLNLPIDGTIPIVIHCAGGAVSNDKLVTISADTTLLLPASSTNYVYVNSAGTKGSTTLAPTYQFGGTPSVTNGQFTFNISEMKAYLGNGTTAPQVYMTFIGEAVTSGSAVTSVVTYALNGQYDSGYTATLPSATAAVSKNHNIGTDELKCSIVAKCTTIDVGFAVGDIFEDISCYGSSYPMKLPIIRSRNIMKFKTGDSGGWYLINQTSGSLAAATLASWSYKLIAKRGF